MLKDSQATGQLVFLLVAIGFLLNLQSKDYTGVHVWILPPEGALVQNNYEPGTI